jgi:hypothetical protein
VLEHSAPIGPKAGPYHRFHITNERLCLPALLALQLVLSTFGFSFTCTLTWVHTMFTLVGMRLFLLAGMFQHKKLQQMQLLPLAAAYVGYIVLCNLSLKINTGEYSDSLLGWPCWPFGNSILFQMCCTATFVGHGPGLASLRASQHAIRVAVGDAV